LAYFPRDRQLVGRLLFFLMEIVGVGLFGLGIVSTLAFLSADTPSEAVQRGLAKIPNGCEAGYYNHGAYLCWFTIRDHVFLFSISVAALLVGGAIIAWAQRHWFRSKRTDGA